MSPEAALAQLLLSLFSAEELRRHVRFSPELSHLTHDLPEASASASALASALVELCARQGLIDAAFFAALRDARPRRGGDIDRVAARFPAQPAAPAQAAPASPGPAPTAAGQGNIHIGAGAVVHVHGDMVGTKTTK